MAKPGTAIRTAGRRLAHPMRRLPVPSSALLPPRSPLGLGRLRKALPHGVARLVAALIALLAAGAFGGGGARANTSHAGWPAITGMLLINGGDQNRPLDGRPGRDPYGGSDPGTCAPLRHGGRCLPGGLNRTVPAGIGHNELLGGHGNNTIHAGPAGDVIWGDYKPSGDPLTQIDHLYGGPGNDIIYAAHGRNYVHTGGGRDIVHAHFGGGEIHCDSADVTVYVSRHSRMRYRLFGCRHVSY